MPLRFTPALALLLAACSPETSGSSPPVAPGFPVGAPMSHPILIEAQNKGAPVVAQCSVGGPTMGGTFTTPARIQVQFEGGRANTTVIECRYNGKTLSTQTPPTPETGTILVDFSNPRTEFWFKHANGGVLYYTRGDVVVRVSGAP